MEGLLCRAGALHCCRLPGPADDSLESLWSGLCHHVLLKRDRSLSQQAAIHGCARIHGDQGLTQHDPFKVRSRPNRHSAGRLPEDVLGQSTTRQCHCRGIGLRQGSCYLEDPDIVRPT